MSLRWTEEEYAEYMRGRGETMCGYFSGACRPVLAANSPLDCLPGARTHCGGEAEKAQGPVEATVCNNDISGAGSWWYQCGKCKMPIDPKDRFCRHCGQEVKWQ